MKSMLDRLEAQAPIIFNQCLNKLGIDSSMDTEVSIYPGIPFGDVEIRITNTRYNFDVSISVSRQEFESTNDSIDFLKYRFSGMAEEYMRYLAQAAVKGPRPGQVVYLKPDEDIFIPSVPSSTGYQPKYTTLDKNDPPRGGSDLTTMTSGEVMIPWDKKSIEPQTPPLALRPDGTVRRKVRV